jgi:hypothetical protein
MMLNTIKRMLNNLKLKRLFKLLDDAEQLAGQFTGGYSDHFFSAEEFHLALKESINKLKAGDTEQLNSIWLWFAPTCDWDDFIHQEGEDLANAIYPLVTELRKSLNM